MTPEEQKTKKRLVARLRRAYERGELTDVQINRAKELGIELERDIDSSAKDLASKRPDLAAEWHPTKNGDLKPADVAAGAHRKVWWQGKCGHEWEASLNSRAKGNGCPYCSNVKVLQGFNDLATRRPDIAAEWHPTKNGDIKPTDVAMQSNKRFWWMCSRGHEWQATLNNRFYHGKGCSICRRQRQVINMETGEEFESIVAAARFYEDKDKPCVSRLRKALQDPTRTAYGYHWKYVSNPPSNA